MEVTREEVLQKANDRGWYSQMSTVDGSWHVMKHKLYSFAIELWPDTNEFQLIYNSGLFTFQSGKCGSFTNDEHFNRLFREMRYMVLNIRDAKEAYQERIAIRKARKETGNYEDIRM